MIVWGSRALQQRTISMEKSSKVRCQENRIPVWIITTTALVTKTQTPEKGNNHLCPVIERLGFTMPTDLTLLFNPTNGNLKQPCAIKEIL